MKYILACSLFLFVASPSWSQIQNPEAIKMKENAQKDLERGNVSNAILLYNQAIKLEPSDVSLRRDLAYAHYLNGTLDQGKSIITEVLNSSYADEQTYQIGAAIEAKLGNIKKASTIINTGLKKYPQSALLHHDKGSLYLASRNTKQAIQSFEAGIIANPNYSSNYLALAKQIQETQPLWALTYLEMFINLEPNTEKTAEAKSLLYKNYVNYFQKSSHQKLPTFGASSNGPSTTKYLDVMTYIIDKNVAAITTGISTESLIMLRSRILLDWNLNFAISTPHSLLSFQEKLINNGYFDAYNQWLFGANENSTQFATWIKTNHQVYGSFEKFSTRNPYQVNSYDPVSFKK